MRENLVGAGIMAVTKTGNGERGAGSGERGTGNGERKSGNELSAETSTKIQNGGPKNENERLNTGMAPTCNWRIKIVQ